jgi:hypothetical protein
VYEPEGRPVQVAPCDDNGDTEHFLYEDCVCGQWETTDREGRLIIVHEDVL